MKIKALCKKILFRNRPPFLIVSKNNITAGTESYHNGNFDIFGDQPVSIGSYCAIAPNVTIHTTNHDYNYPAMQYTFYKRKLGMNNHPGASTQNPSSARTKGPVKIGSDVWIAQDVIIMSGVTIEDGAIVGAGAIVTKDVPPYAIVAGIPAKEIKKRFNPDIIELLQDLKWWNWSDERIKRNAEFFQTNLNTTDISSIKHIIQN